MSALTWLGHWQTWLLLLTVWGGLGCLTALAVGIMARVGSWQGRKRP